ncbi:MAG: hypothetical protein HYR96_01560 [Deltaproteobacteria bacterium]|nr:hypothetical protein [Deltaproteobacteria bacterium]MBI3294419.1 hypothetical protein [Deltaproteobacteria bacterium]
MKVVTTPSQTDQDRGRTREAPEAALKGPLRMATTEDEELGLFGRLQ